jgi:hypothetical protein
MLPVGTSDIMEPLGVGVHLPNAETKEPVS